MANQVYNVGADGTNNIVSVLNPFAVVNFDDYMEGEVDALEYSDSAGAASVANYLNGQNLGQNFVVVGPHPRPH